MQDNKRNPNLKLSDGLYRLDHPDSDLFLSKSIRESSVRTLGDYYQQLREVRIESNESNKSNFSDKSYIYNESDGSLTITVPRHRSDSGSVSVTVINSEPDIRDNDNNNFQHVCPNNPLRQCNCGDKCADTDFEPTTSQGKDISGWSGPCVVVGATEGADNGSAESISTGSDNSKHEAV